MPGRGQGCPRPGRLQPVACSQLTAPFRAGPADKPVVGGQASVGRRPGGPRGGRVQGGNPESLLSGLGAARSPGRDELSPPFSVITTPSCSPCPGEQGRDWPAVAPGSSAGDSGRRVVAGQQRPVPRWSRSQARGSLSAPSGRCAASRARSLACGRGRGPPVGLGASPPQGPAVREPRPPWGTAGSVHRRCLCASGHAAPSSGVPTSVLWGPHFKPVWEAAG